MKAQREGLIKEKEKNFSSNKEDSMCEEKRKIAKTKLNKFSRKSLKKNLIQYFLKQYSGISNTKNTILIREGLDVLEKKSLKEIIH